MLALSLTASADDTKEKSGKFSDANFVKMVFSDNMHESKLGEIGQLKGQNPQVREFAKRLVLDHGMAQNSLREAAQLAKIKVPDKMTAKDQKDVEKYQNYKGKNFDADFTKHMVEDHKKGIELYTKATKQAKNEAIRNYAEKTLPVLKQHLEIAQKLQEQTKK